MVTALRMYDEDYFDDAEKRALICRAIANYGWQRIEEMARTRPTSLAPQSALCARRKPGPSHLTLLIAASLPQ